MHNLRKSKNLLQVVIVNNCIRTFYRTFGNEGIELSYARKRLFDAIIYGKYSKIKAKEFGKYPRKVNKGDKLL